MHAARLVGITEKKPKGGYRERRRIEERRELTTFYSEKPGVKINLERGRGKNRMNN